MSKIKVLIIDDSALMREALTRILSQDKAIEVVGTAPDPYIAIEKIKNLNPDVLTLDIEMPKMDGLTFLDKIMRSHPMPVIMISTWTTKNSEQAIKALSLGAIDFVEKPSSDLQNKILALESEIVIKVKNAANCKVRRAGVGIASLNKFPDIGQNKIINESMNSGADLNDKVISTKAGGSPPIKSNKIVLIGASTGGTTAVETIVKGLELDTPGIVIVQHMPENFTKAYANRLNNLYKLTVKEAEDGDIVYKNTIYIAPGGKQCYIKRVMGYFTIQIADNPPVDNYRPSVDALFMSATKNPCQNVIGVILTGMGHDGARGMLALKKAGSYNIAQDETTSVVFGMPKEAIELGAVHQVLELNKVASRLKSLTM